MNWSAAFAPTPTPSKRVRPAPLFGAMPGSFELQAGYLGARLGWQANVASYGPLTSSERLCGDDPRYNPDEVVAPR